MKTLADAANGRRLRQQKNLSQTEAIIDGRRATVFAGNDYLGLASHPEVIQAAAKALADYGNSAGGSRLISGNHHLYAELESSLADFKQKEAALVFATGFMANLGLLSAVAGPKDVIYIDKLSHASIYDGSRLSDGAVRRYPHNNLDKLERLLAGEEVAGRRLIVTEGVFSMDGDCAPLPDLKRLASKYSCLLIVDDAHGTGVLGPEGRGTAAHLGVTPDVEIGTLSKAIGGLGGFVAGSRELIDFLVAKARPFIYSTGLPPATLAGAIAAVSIIRTQGWRRERVLALAERARARLNEAGWRIPAGFTPIIPLIVNDAGRAEALSGALLDKGVFIPAVKAPSVPARQARLRLTISAAHSDEELDNALNVLASVGMEMGLI